MTDPIEQLTVKDLMSTDLLTLPATGSLPTADRIMQLARIRHLPVVDGDRLVGLVTHRDLLSARLSDLSPLSSDQRAKLQKKVCVADIMNRDVWTVRPSTTALAAVRLLRDHRFGCLPVAEDGTLLGIVTEADFLGVFEELVDEAKVLRVQTVMTPAPVTLQDDTTCAEALEAMSAYRIRHLPLLGPDGKVTGLVLERGLLVAQAIGQHLHSAAIPVSLVATEPFTVSPGEPLRATLSEMAERRVDAALVLKDDKLVGVLTTTDVCRFFGSR